MKCDQKTEVYSRVVGYHRPINHWNKGKREEFKERQEFNPARAAKPAATAATTQQEGIR